VFRANKSPPTLTAWSILTGGLGIMFLWAAFDQASYGFVLHGHAAAWQGAVFAAMMFVWGPMWVLVLRRRAVRWVRIDPDRGLALGEVRTIAWSDVAGASRVGSLVDVTVKRGRGAFLGGVEDAGRFVALVRRHAARSVDA
jgi:hypothetical protein